MKAASVRPITDLKNRTKELVQEVADSGQAVIITQNGKARAVLMDVEQHDRLLDTLAMLKLLAQSQETVARTGRVYSTRAVRRRARAAIERAART